MSHVDEGKIAEYLDGAAPEKEIEQHLAGCGECRALVERARAERERARAILRTRGIKGSATPSFADVLERAKARDVRKSDVRRLGRVTSLAWAATVVLAVGLGWYARQLSFRSSVLQEREASDMSVKLNTAPVESAAVNPPAALSTLSEPEKKEQPSNRRTQAPRSVAAADRQVAAAPPPAPSAPTPTVRRDQAGAPAGGQASGELSPAKDVAAAREEPVAELGRSRAPEPSAAARFAEAPANQPALEKALSDARWTDTTASAAARVLGSQPLIVPGLPVERYAVSRAGEPAVRVIQRLGDGNELELVQRRTRIESALSTGPSRAGSRAPAAMAVRPGLADELDASGGVTVQRGGYTITLQAPVSRDSLLVLQARLR